MTSGWGPSAWGDFPWGSGASAAFTATTTMLASIIRYFETNGIQPDPSNVQVIRALEDASAYIRNYTGRTFTLVEDDEVLLDGTGRDSLLLPQIPAISVSAVSVTERWSTTPEALDSDDWVLDSAGILWRRDGGCWSYGHANIDVIYDHGYQVVPAAIQAACIAIATLQVTSAASGASGPVESEQILSYQVTYASASSSTAGSEGRPTVGDILERYRATGLTDEPMVPASS